MNLRHKAEMASRVLKVGRKRVWLNPKSLADFKQAMTRDDIKKLASEGSILVKQKRGISRGRNRYIQAQKKKGRRQGHGSRKGAKTARMGKKILWIMKIRSQRKLISDYASKNIISRETYSDLRRKAKGGFFRSVRHINLYLTERELWNKKK